MHYYVAVLRQISLPKGGGKRRGNMKALREGLEGIPLTKRPAASDGENRREGSE